MAALDSLRSLVRDPDQAVFEDPDLQAALDIVGGSDLLRAAGVAFQSLAAEYATLGKSVKTADLAIDTRGRGTDLNEVAKSFFDQALALQVAGADDFITVAEPGGRTPDCSHEWPLFWGGWSF